MSISKVELLELMSTKNSVAELLTEKFNNTAPYYYNVIRKLVKEYNLEDNYRELTLRGRSFTNYCRVNRKLSNESIFCCNSNKIAPEVATTKTFIRFSLNEKSSSNVSSFKITNRFFVNNLL